MTTDLSDVRRASSRPSVLAAGLAGAAVGAGRPAGGAAAVRAGRSGDARGRSRRGRPGRRAPGRWRCRSSM